MLRASLAAALFLSTTISIAFAAGTIEMVPQPQLNQGISVAAVSGDGLVVVGTSADQRAFRWRLGSASLEYITPTGALNNAFGISGDGQTVVGRYDQPTKAFRWTSAGGLQNLPKLYPPDDSPAFAEAASYDGSVIVGESDDQAFRWSQSTGTVGLGFGYCCLSNAVAVSGNGNVAAGYTITAATYNDFGTEAFRWTSGGGMVALGDLPGGAIDSEAWAISGDGSVIAGWATTASGKEAFRWTAAGGMVGLGHLSGPALSIHIGGMSADGKRIVGQELIVQNQLYQTLPFVWDAQLGLMGLRQFLEQQHGVDLQGWNFYDAAGISADGNVILALGTVGAAQNVWARVAVPEPASLSLSILLIGALAGRISGRRR